MNKKQLCKASIFVFQKTLRTYLPVPWFHRVTNHTGVSHFFAGFVLLYLATQPRGRVSGVSLLPLSLPLKIYEIDPGKKTFHSTFHVIDIYVLSHLLDVCPRLLVECLPVLYSHVLQVCFRSTFVFRRHPLKTQLRYSATLKCWI